MPKFLDKLIVTETTTGAPFSYAISPVFIGSVDIWTNTGYPSLQLSIQAFYTSEDFEGLPTGMLTDSDDHYYLDFKKNVTKGLELFRKLMSRSTDMNARAFPRIWGQIKTDASSSYVPVWIDNIGTYDLSHFDGAYAIYESGSWTIHTIPNQYATIYGYLYPLYTKTN